jgi:hypothetical protein
VRGLTAARTKRRSAYLALCWSGCASILLIYDNAFDANTLEPYQPRGEACQVLVTSNAHAWRGVAEPVEISIWLKEIGADYLIARNGRHSERNAAEILSESLGGLPLAHEQAAAYCECPLAGIADASRLRPRACWTTHVMRQPNIMMG